MNRSKYISGAPYKLSKKFDAADLAVLLVGDFMEVEADAEKVQWHIDRVAQRYPSIEAKFEVSWVGPLATIKCIATKLKMPRRA